MTSWTLPLQGVRSRSDCSARRGSDDDEGGGSDDSVDLTQEKDVTIVSVDGGCPGVENVKAGIIGAAHLAQEYHDSH